MLGAFTYWQLHVHWGLPSLARGHARVVRLRAGSGCAARGRHHAPAPGHVRGDPARRVGQPARRGAEPRPAVVEPAGGASASRASGRGRRSRSSASTSAGTRRSRSSWPSWSRSGLRLLLYRTRAGVTMRAAVDDRPLATLNGARPDRSAMLAWAIGCSLAALAGILIAPDLGAAALLLTLLIVNAYAAAMIGPAAQLAVDVRRRGHPRSRRRVRQRLSPEDERLRSARTHRPLPQRLPRRDPRLDPVHRVAGAAAIAVAGTQRGALARELTRRRRIAGRSSARGCCSSASPSSRRSSRTRTHSLTRLFGFAIIALSLVPLVGLRRADLAVPDELRRHRRARHGAQRRGGPAVDAACSVAVVCGVVGAIVALPALRLSGIYFALATGAFAVILDRWIFNLPALQHRPAQGQASSSSNRSPVHRLHVPGVDPSSERSLLVVVAAMFCVLACSWSRCAAAATASVCSR